jgi:ATP-dependent exoDNAse (exonuclease V) alpha subunit
MAIYRFSAKIVKRSDGRSATAAAAYRAGAVIPDERTGRVFDYTRRRGVTHTEIIAPPGTAPRFLKRISLWNAVEAAERRHDAQVAREIELALPHELDAAVRLELVREFVRREFVARGMIADVAVHRPDRRGDRRNHHAHVMLTLRPLSGEGLGPKAREWNDTGLLEHWREAWADAVNLALRDHGHTIRVDHRSYAERSLEIEPERKMGPVATAMERRGRRSHAGDDRRAVRARNRKRIMSEHELVRIDEELHAIEAELAASRPPAVPCEAGPSVNSRVSFADRDAQPRPPPRATRTRHAAGWKSYLFRMWTTVARAVTTPFRNLASVVTRRSRPELRR